MHCYVLILRRCILICCGQHTWLAASRVIRAWRDKSGSVLVQHRKFDSHKIDWRSQYEEYFSIPSEHSGISGSLKDIIGHRREPSISVSLYEQPKSGKNGLE